MELTALRADHARIEALGARILGISVDHIWAQKAFAVQLGGLSYPLLADWSKSVARRYGVLNEEGGFATRSVFLIDRGGTIGHVIPRFDARKTEHYEEVIRELERLA